MGLNLLEDVEEALNRVTGNIYRFEKGEKNAIVMTKVRYPGDSATIFNLTMGKDGSLAYDFFGDC